MAYGEFVQIQSNGSKTLWTRLALGDTGGRDETWLRDLLQSDPRLIPIGEIDPSFGPLFPVRTELKTPAGRIDNVFIDRLGRLTLVECKLWRNPESRRKVVAQILDYAKELGSWSFADLQREVNARTGSTGSSLYDSIQKAHPELSEHRFADAVTRSLRAGRFLLLVAGDGIQEDALALGGLLNRSVTSGFSFGMFEVALYRNESDDLLIQSRPVVRTQLIERTIVVRADGSFGDGEEEDFGAIAEPLAAKSEAANKVHKDAADWWAPVLESSLDDPEQLPFCVPMAAPCARSTALAWNMDHGVPQ